MQKRCGKNTMVKKPVLEPQFPIVVTVMLEKSGTGYEALQNGTWKEPHFTQSNLPNKRVTQAALNSKRSPVNWNLSFIVMAAS